LRRMYMIWVPEVAKWQAYALTEDGNLISNSFFWISMDAAKDISVRQEWYAAIEDLAGMSIDFVWLEPFVWEGD
jgi:hypothetical protein